jgi:hypothetical protein
MLNNIIKATQRQEFLNIECQYNHLEVQIVVLKGANYRELSHVSETLIFLSEKYSVRTLHTTVEHFRSVYGIIP